MIPTTMEAVDPFTFLRPTARGSVNRGRLRKLAEQGRLEGRVDYQFDDMLGSSSSDEWLPVRLAERGGLSPAGVLAIDPEDFASDVGRAYVADSSRAQVADRRLYLRVHSALRYELRVVPAPGPGVARAAARVPELSEEEWWALELAEVAWLPSAPTGMTGAVARLLSLGLVERWIGKLEQAQGDRWATVQVVRATGDGIAALARRPGRSP